MATDPPNTTNIPHLNENGSGRDGTGGEEDYAETSEQSNKGTKKNLNFKREFSLGLDDVSTCFNQIKP